MFRCILCFLLIAIDQIVKFATVLNLPLVSMRTGYPYGGIGVFQNVMGVEFSLVHATNTGAAWSMFQDYPSILLFARIVLISLLVIYLFFAYRDKIPLPWVLILSGAISNVIDHFLYGHVIDMFHFILWGYDYPVFNVADSLIVIGAFILIFSNTFSAREHAEQRKN
ncbi:signal peptidase II [Estrella lausannensis]|uniref:Lipoprotein signal peptidase n=1 Tax=Estrella lausannensis TaxID=483423 RepID=A0A0H5E653_9BACT|nr:signal peptidase II [Estrella lausannensis]CRX38740.1 Lipoprotein signal peptidase [Estrella lausannensis]